MKIEDHGSHTTAEVICGTCNCGWSERYIGPQIVAITLDDGTTAHA